MEPITFYPKNKKTNHIWKFFSVLLLSSGASSAADIDKVIISDKVIIKAFLANDIIMEFDDIEIIRDESGNPYELSTKTDVFRLSKIKDSEGLVKVIEEKIAQKII